MSALRPASRALRIAWLCVVLACNGDPLPPRAEFVDQRPDAVADAKLVDAPQDSAEPAVDAAETKSEVAPADVPQDGGLDAEALDALADAVDSMDADAGALDAAVEASETMEDATFGDGDTATADAEVVACPVGPETCNGVDDDCDGDTDEGSCDDGNVCTLDECVPGGCAHAAVLSACSDANLCTLNDVCKDKACVAGPVKVCDDGDPCTLDVCLAAAGCDALPCTDVDECKLGTAACDLNAACTNTIGSYTCACKAGYTGDGKTCADLDECSVDNGGCGANSAWSCVNNPGGAATCQDVNECANGSAMCSADAKCTNAVGSYVCQCDAGWQGDGKTCADIDECATGTAKCSTAANCLNAIGSYACQCKPGFAGDGKTCADVDECQGGLAPCDKNATCANTIGSYVCQCKAGWGGNGTTCADVDECAPGSKACDANANCANTGGSFSCACKAGFVGDGKTCKPGVGQAGNPALTCGAILADQLAAVSGSYWIDVDGATGSIAPFQGYCDFTSEGGAWLLAAQQVPSQVFTDTGLDFQLANANSLTKTFRLGNQKLQTIAAKVAWRITSTGANGGIVDHAWFKPGCKIDWTNYVGTYGNSTNFDDKCGIAYTSGTFAAVLGGTFGTFNCAKGIGQNNSGAYCSIRMGSCGYDDFKEGQALPCNVLSVSTLTLRLWVK